MPNEKQTYEKLEKALLKLRDEKEKRRKTERLYKEAKERYTDSLRHKERLYRDLSGLMATVNIPRIYLDHQLNILEFSNDFPATGGNLRNIAGGRRKLEELLEKKDIDRIRQYLKKVEALESLPYDSELEWKLKYKGPDKSDKIGESWIALSDSDKIRWKIVDDSGKLVFLHKPHIQDRVDCYLMSAEEYGGADEDIKVIYRIKTPTKEENIRDLSLVLSGSAGSAGMLCDAAGYTVCTGSFYNTETRIQRKTADIINKPEKLKTNAEYEITVERTGGKISRILKNLETRKKAPPFQVIDSSALYDGENHLGFTTFSGEAKIYGIKVYTRKSRFAINQFRIPFNLEVRLKDKGLKNRAFRVGISKNQSGKNIFYTLFFEDITERKNVENALRMSEKKYRELVENINDALYSVDDKGVLKYISPVVESILGYEPSEITGHPFTDFVYREDIPFVTKRFEEILAGDNTPTECRLLKKSNEICWIHASTSPIIKEGRVVGFHGIITDISERKRAEESLQETEDRYRQLIHNIPLGLYRNTPGPKGKFIMANQAVARMHGFEKIEDFLRIPVAELYWEPKKRNIFSEKLIARGEIFREELLLKKRDGTSFWGAVSAKVIRDDSGKISYFDGIVEDITKQKEAEEALRENEEKYRTLFGTSPEAVMVFNAETLRFFEVNQTAVDLYGYSKEEFLKLTPRDVCTEPDKLKNGLDRLYAEMKIEVMDTTHKRKDGTTIPVELYASQIKLKDQNFVIAFVRDVTDRRKTEEALRMSEERFRNIADETDEWVWEIGKDMVFKYSNLRVKEILGYEPEEVIGKSFLDFMSEKELYRVESKKDYLLRDVIFAGQETYLVRKDGKTIITESSGVPIFRRNRTFIGFQGLTRDITERVQIKKAEEHRREQLIQADKMISLGILVSGVAHEINNPNQFIMVNTPMLKRAWENITPILDRYYEENGDFMLAGLAYSDMRERVPGLFSGISEGSQRIKHIVRNLKDYAREGGSEITQEIDINAILQSALTILANLLKKSTKKLKVIYAENLPSVRGNFQRIEQVLINLIQNACQALPDPMKGITITTSHNKKNGTVVVRIKDEGVGIKEDHKKYILDPFFTSRRDSGGTGLGLSISAGIIEEHGGKLEFSSVPERGTNVLVVLPVSGERKSSPG